MGSILDMKQTDDVMVHAFCNDVYVELEGMRLKLMTIIDELAIAYGEESHPYATYKRHLKELSDQFEWKLQILSHSCPYDWKGSATNIESTVTVQPVTVTDPEFSGGYVGG